MPVSDIVLLLGAIGVLVTTIAGAVVTLRRVAAVKEDVQGVHKIVNQQRTDMLAYQQVLVDALKDKGIHVPTDVSVEKE